MGIISADLHVPTPYVRLVVGSLLALALLCCRPGLTAARTVREGGEEPSTSEDYPWGVDDLGDEDWPILCPPDNWFSKEKDQCLPCSACPLDHVVVRPCYRLHDSECAPLPEIPAHFLVPRISDPLEPLGGETEGGDGVLGQRGGRRGKGHAEDEWRPAAVALGVITGVLVLALIVTSVAVCVVWRKQQGEEPPKKMTEKLVCSYSPAPSETV